MAHEVAATSVEMPDRTFAASSIFALAFVVAALSLTGLFLAPVLAGEVVILRGAGVAMGALLVFGTGLWPGVLLGSLFGRLIAHWAGSGSFPMAAELIDIAVMPMVATAQALIGVGAIRKVFGHPLHARSFGQVLVAGGVLVPLICTLNPSFGIALFAVSHPPGSANLLQSWVVWWCGDLIGLCLALPVALLGPWNRVPAVFWRGTALPQFTRPAIIYLALSVTVTFLSWQQVSKLGSRSDEAQFETLVRDNAQALRHRVESYDLGLGGGVGLVRASQRITLVIGAAMWRR